MMDVIALTQQFVRTPSPVPTGNELAMANLIEEVLDEAGLPLATRVSRADDRPNLATTIDFGPGGRHLVLAGHIDTKPVGEAQWSVDPFAADIIDGKLYGLGSADMKAGVAAMIVAASSVAAGSDLTSGRLSLVFTADEEHGAEYGAKYAASRFGLNADALIVGEPGGIHTDYDSLHLVSRGLSRFVVTARARQCHSSLSALLGFRNAGVDLAEAIVDLSHARLAQPPNEDNLRDWQSTMNPAMKYGGGYGYGVLPEFVTTTVEVRTIPGQSPDQLLSQLRAVLLESNARTGADVEIDFDNPPDHAIEPTWVRAGEPIVAAIHAVATETFGHGLPESVFPGTTDTTWFAEAYPITACLPALGPGLLRHAHGADEFVDVAAVRATPRFYERIARSFLPVIRSEETR